MFLNFEIVLSWSSFAKDNLRRYENNKVENSKKVNYFPRYIAYEIRTKEQENPADLPEGVSIPPPLKTLVHRKIYVQISPDLSYEISYSVEDIEKYQYLINKYDQIISTLKFLD